MRMIKVRRSFSAKISLWVLLLTVPIFIGSLGLLYMQSRQLVRDEAVDRAHGVLNASMQRISRYLITTETTANAYCWKVEETKNPDSLMALSHRIVELNPYVDGCVISFEPGVIPGYPKQFMALDTNMLILPISWNCI